MAMIDRIFGTPAIFTDQKFDYGTYRFSAEWRIFNSWHAVESEPLYQNVQWIVIENGEKPAIHEITSFAEFYCYCQESIKSQVFLMAVLRYEIAAKFGTLIIHKVPTSWELRLEPARLDHFIVDDFMYNRDFSKAEHCGQGLIGALLQTKVINHLNSKLVIKK